MFNTKKLTKKDRISLAASNGLAAFNNAISSLKESKELAAELVAENITVIDEKQLENQELLTNIEKHNNVINNIENLLN